MEQKEATVTLNQMWEEHREHLRRMLVGLTRDLDLAEDLLQETYINASRGIGSYRGDNLYAWLAAIARNVFFARARRKYYNSELPLEEDVFAETDSHIGSNEHISEMRVRQAVSELPENLRFSLIMKHYGGFTYSEIAARLGCPQGTAQQRVWTAMQRLKAALQEESIMSCENLTEGKLLDYIYGILPERETGEVESHLKDCPDCRREVEELRMLATALDAVEDQYKVNCIWELDKEGGATFYGTDYNPKGDPQDFNYFGMRLHKAVQLRYVTLNGREIMPEPMPEQPKDILRPNQIEYVVRLSEPIKAGEPVVLFTVCYIPSVASIEGSVDQIEKALEDSNSNFDDPDHETLRRIAKAAQIDRLPEEAMIPATKQIAEVMRHHTPGNSLFLNEHYSSPGEVKVTNVSVRTPPGTKVLYVYPEPTDTKTGRVNTFVWRRMLTHEEPLVYAVEYRC